VNGSFGAVTERAVKRFQRRRRIPASGKVGPATRRAMRLARFSRASVRKRRARPQRRSGVRLPRILRQIAQCESGGDPTAVSPGGRYRGKWQFSQATWERYGGRGDPAEASEARQDRVALRLYRAEGTRPWPNCP
jgi:hypothetical protein